MGFDEYCMCKRFFRIRQRHLHLSFSIHWLVFLASFVSFRPEELWAARLLPLSCIESEWSALRSSVCRETACSIGEAISLWRWSHESRRNNIAAFGQLENNLRWEVVFTDTASKIKFMGTRGMCEVKGQPATVDSLRQLHLRMQRGPMCVPNEFLSYLLRKEDVKVVGTMSYEVDKEFGLTSNTRVAWRRYLLTTEEREYK